MADGDDDAPITYEHTHCKRCGKPLFAAVGSYVLITHSRREVIARYVLRVVCCGRDHFFHRYAPPPVEGEKVRRVQCPFPDCGGTLGQELADRIVIVHDRRIYEVGEVRAITCDRCRRMFDMETPPPPGPADSSAPAPCASRSRSALVTAAGKDFAFAAAIVAAGR